MDKNYIESLNEIFEGISDKVMERGWMTELVNTNDFDLYIHVKEDSDLDGFTDVIMSFTDFSEEGFIEKDTGYELTSWFYDKLVKDYRSRIDFEKFRYIYLFFNQELIVQSFYDLEDFDG